ncbi:MAG: hypothetical protein ACYSTX_01440 [Planctomycetota bacterium]|jgi:hypothetical protein
MKKIRKEIDLIAFIVVCCLCVWTVTTSQYTPFQHQKANAEFNLFELSIEELMEVEVASVPQEKETIPKTSWASDILRNRV